MANRPPPRRNGRHAQEPIQLETGDFESLDIEDDDLPDSEDDPEATRDRRGQRPADPQRALPTNVINPDSFNPPLSSDLRIPSDTHPLPPRERDSSDQADITHAPPPVSEASALDPAFLYVDRGPGEGRNVPIPEGDLVIGRSSSCHLKLSHPSVSREHAVITRHDSRFFVRDAGSHNGTYVNGRQISSKRELFADDEIALGKAVLLLRCGSTCTGPHTSTAVPLTERGGFKIAIFGSAVSLGILAVLVVARLSPTPVDRPPAPTPVSALRVSRTAEPKPPPSEPETPPAPARADPPTVVKVEPAKGRDLSLVNPSETSASKVFQEAKNRGDQPAADFEIPRKFIDHKTKAPKYQSKRPTPQPQPQPQPTRVARAPTPAVETGDAAEAMALYEAGDLDGAIAAARSVGNNGLANKIASFKKEIATAKADLSFKDGAGAIKHYTSALTIDDELSKGWGKLGGQIRVELSKLYQIAGMQAVEKGDNAKAAVHLEKALKYDPDNDKAKSLLQKVKSSGPGTGSSSSAPAGKPADARSAADQAFGE